MNKSKAVKILVIDDEAYIRDGVKSFLEDYSYDVLAAENGTNGLELFQQESPDLVLYDPLMPDIGGIEFLELIVAKAPETPIIIISDAASISYTVTALKMGAWDYIIKPMQDMTVLLHAIGKAFERVALIKEKELYKVRLLNKAVDAGRAQLAAMILHNIGNAITPVAVYAEKLKNRNPLQTQSYLAKCYDDLLEHKNNLTEYITTDPRGLEVAKYMGTLIKNIETESQLTSSIIDKIISGITYVTQILDIQRNYAPSEIEAREKIDINVVINDVIKMNEFSISQFRICLEKKLLDNIPHIFIEKNKLIQVIANLIKNSCDAISENKSRTDHKLEITTYCYQEFIGLKIKDTGIGVSKELQKNIFNFGISSKGSSGFGLYYCKSFVEENNGTLIFESEGNGFGSTVTMEMPFTTVSSKEKI